MMINFYIRLIFLFIACFFGFQINSCFAKDIELKKNQIIELIPETVDVKPGSSVIVAIKYDVSNNDNTLLGLGARIHYNSSLIEYYSMSNIFNLFKSPVVQNDKANFDNDDSTDKYILLAWFEWNGKWPGRYLPCNLGEIKFNISDSDISNNQKALINVTFSSVNPGYHGKAVNTFINIANE